MVLNPHTRNSWGEGRVTDRVGKGDMGKEEEKKRGKWEGRETKKERGMRRWEGGRERGKERKKGEEGREERGVEGKEMEKNKNEKKIISVSL